MIRYLICLIGAAALAQQPPIPALRPIPQLPSVSVRTNITETAIIVTTTLVIPKETTKAYYYGVRSSELMQPHLVQLGYWTKSEFESWAFNGAQTIGTGGGPQIQLWTAVFSTTNRIEPTLIHAKNCP